ncbi:helix-turn-helix domain-containing protein [Jannaschia sp. Os4]|uniref:helix-turn-helix transcriptional regulator n=1 Tax=Jannaschia sp. Os4 TaxID=2807617 RepID=UPI00193A77B4|nr:AraC family transcriptional regulator [Jannaschia sp. Os4]MBM2578013.1 helix-turn-helix domain-containing protein [Jannaschia sp. Os4]
MRCRTFHVEDYVAPGEAYGVTVKPIGPQVPATLHRHDYHELMVVLEGPLVQRTDTAATALVTGTAAFLRPDDRHLVHAPRRARARILNVVLRSAEVDALGARHARDCAGRFWWTDAPEPDLVTLPPAVFRRATEGIAALAEGPRTPLRLEAFLTGLIADVLRDPVALDPGLPPWLARACRRAMDPAVFRGGAAALAEAAGRSHEHLCRSMKAHLGQSPTTYLNGVRMDHAARLLRDGDQTVEAVAEAVGLSNLGHFYRLFRRHHGTTPRGYRQSARRAPV